MRISTLPRVVPAPPGKPVRAQAEDNQRKARDIAIDPANWSTEAARAMRTGFDAAAANWEADRGGYRRPPLADALDRGGPFRPGLAVEIAAGTGLLTPLVRAIWPSAVGVDLSFVMLRRSRFQGQIQADAARLPLRDGIASAVVIGDGPLFAAEIARVMAGDATLVWSNALGTGAPFYVPADVLLSAMERATGRPWQAVGSEAHWGSWLVLRPIS